MRAEGIWGRIHVCAKNAHPRWSSIQYQRIRFILWFERRLLTRVFRFFVHWLYLHFDTTAWVWYCIVTSIWYYYYNDITITIKIIKHSDLRFVSVFIMIFIMRFTFTSRIKCIHVQWMNVSNCFSSRSRIFRIHSWIWERHHYWWRTAKLRPILGALCRDGSLSCHTCYDTGPRFIWSHPRCCLV